MSPWRRSRLCLSGSLVGVLNAQWPPGGGSDPAALLQHWGPLTVVEVQVPPALATLLQSQGASLPQPVLGLALVETGASITAVDRRVIESLGVPPVGVQPVGTAGGVQNQFVYPASLRLAAMDVIVDFNSVLGADLQGQASPVPDVPLICLIGRDVLREGVLFYNGLTGAWTLARND